MHQKRDRVMKVTLYHKTIRSKRERVSSLGLEPLMARIGNDAQKRVMVEALRAQAPALSPSLRQRYMERLPRICPGMETHQRRNGQLISTYNGIVLLEINDLNSIQEALDIKRRVAGWPTTLAAMTGSSGRSVKVFVRGTMEDGTLPEDSALIERFHTLLYDLCAKVYATVIGRPLHSKVARPTDTFRWTCDPDAYYTAEAAPVRISGKDLYTGLTNRDESQQEYGSSSIYPSSENRQRFAKRFALAVRQMKEQIEKDVDSGQHRETLSDNEATLSYEQQLTLIAQNCAKMGLPIEETIEQSYFWSMRHIESRERARALVESAYLSLPRKGIKEHGMQEITMELQAFMNERYDLRFNELTNGVEYRFNNSASYVFQPLDTRVMNTMIQEAQEYGIEVFDRDMRRFLGSTRVRSYNIAHVYLRDIEHRWDGKTDYIGELADRVPNRNPHWREWFHTWFLGMVAQWEGFNPGHGNAVVPLLIGQQGCGKSTFGQLILPPELRQTGYRELVDFSSKQEAERMLTTSLLINLDEFNQIPEKIQQGFLKNLLQKSSVKGRRPYSPVTIEMPRMASFIATSNMSDVLNDPSGSRRFIVAEISEGLSIDTSGGIPYAFIYSQALQELYQQHRRCYFTPEEVQQIEAHNARYTNLRPEISRFLEVFDLMTAENEKAQWMSVSELAAEIRRQTRFEYSNKSVNYLGRWLTSESRSMRLSKKIRHGFAVYSVRQRKEKG